MCGNDRLCAFVTKKNVNVERNSLFFCWKILHIWMFSADLRLPPSCYDEAALVIICKSNFQGNKQLMKTHSSNSSI